MPTTEYSYFGFTGDPQNTFTSAGSDDGVTWTNIGGSWAGQINAPQVFLSSGTYYFHVAAANDSNFALVPWNIGSANSSGIVTTTATVDWTSAISGVHSCFSGGWFDDGTTVHLFVPCSTSDLSHFQIYETHAASPFTSWSSPVLVTVTGQTNLQDPKVWLIGGTYYMWVVDTGTHLVELASASTLLGPYTMQRTGDWAGWGSNHEGPTMYSTGATSWRLAIEDISSGGNKHTMFYSDCNTLDLLSCTWTALQPWHEDQKYRHGSILKNY